MVKAAYVIGALDALVKSGAVSPEYAVGAAVALEKAAGLFSDTSYADTMKALADWRTANPGKKLTSDDAWKIMNDNGFDWNDSRIGGWAHLKNRVGAWTSHINPWATETHAQYDERLRNAKNERQLDVLRKWEGQNYHVDPEFAGALRDSHARTARNVELDSRDYMDSVEREQAGFTDGTLQNKFRTTDSEMAAASGVYKPTVYTPNKPDPTAVRRGRGLSNQYGENKNMFYNRGYFNPTDL